MSTTKKPARRPGTGAACVLLACATVATAAPAPPPPLQGRWVVQQVAVDRDDAIQRSNEPDDPRLMGGILDILADGTVDPAREDCKGATWERTQSTTVARLVARNKRTSSGKTFTPTLEEYGLALGNPTVVPYVALCAPAASSGKRQPYNGRNWFAALSNDRMIEGNGVDTVLVYDRITAATPVRPSFACNGNLNDSEKAICGSQVLAGLDRSVALAYKRASERQREQKQGTDELRKAQAAWIAERDRCKADESCLTASMFGQIGALMQQ